MRLACSSHTVRQILEIHGERFHGSRVLRVSKSEAIQLTNGKKPVDSIDISD